MSKALATKNVAAALVAVALVFGFAFAIARPAKADTLTDLQAQVQALLAQIAQLQSAAGSSTGGGACFTFTQNLKMGQTGSEVMQLQKYLNNGGYTVAATGAGSPGNETSYFGALTKAAVVQWQNANASSVLTPVGLVNGTGYWGPSSRAFANANCTSTGNNGGGTTTPTGPGLTVSASAQPANSLAPQSASRVPFTTFTLTNNTGSSVTVSGITVQRTGLASDAVFSGVVLVDSSGAQIGVAHTFNANHQTTIGDTFTLNPGQSMTYTVAGNMAASLSSYAGQVAGISVVGVNTSVPVSGSLPITGAYQTINASLSIGSVTASLSGFDPNSAQTKNIGDTAVKFTGVRLQAGSVEDVKLFSIRWRLNGSASASDISNVVAVVNGTTYPTTLSADGRYYTVVFPGGLLIQKGFSAEAYVQGDLTGTNSAGRIVELDIDKTSDIYVVGQVYGYGIVPTVTSSGSISTASTHGTALLGTNQPWFQGSTITIQGGTVTTISNAPEVASQNIAVNVPNQPLGGFATNFLGEAVSVQNMVFEVATSSSSCSTGNCLLTSVSIVDENGSVVAGPVDATYAGSQSQKLTFSNTVTFPTGRHVYQLKGTVPSGTGSGQTYIVSTNPGSTSFWSNITGQSTGNTVSLSGVGSFNMNTMTVKAASLTMTISTTPSAQTIVRGGQGVLLGNIQLDATQSGEDVRLSSIPVHVHQLSLNAGDQITGLSACQLYDSNGNSLNYGSNIVNSGSTFLNSATSTAVTTYTKNISLSNQLTVPKGTLVTLAFKCNVSSSVASGDAYTVGVYSGDTLSATGAVSGNTVSGASITTGYAGTQTIATSGSLSVSNDASSPSVALAAGGQTGVTIGVAKFRPSNEAVNLTKIGVTLTNGTYTGPSGAQDLGTVHLFANGVEIGQAIFAGNATSATSTLTSVLNLPKDTDTVVTIKADLADIGSSQPGKEGDLVKVDIENYEGTGANSGTTVQGGSASGLTTTSGVRLVNSFPTVAQGTLSSSAGSVAAGKLMRFSVTADSHGTVGIYRFRFQISTSSSVTIAGLNLYGYTDQTYSTPISGQQSGGAILASSVTATSTDIIPITVNSGTSPIEVPAGQTYYFELRGSTGGYTTGSSITTTLLGDTTFNGMTTATANGGNFIWSPNATTTSVAASNDWTNGGSVVGLPAGGLIQTVTQ